MDEFLPDFIALEKETQGQNMNEETLSLYSYMTRAPMWKFQKSFL